MTPRRRLIVQTGSSHRVAIRLKPDVVGAHLPPGVTGSYLLYHGLTPVYVGRSDTCLRRRLMEHPLRRIASHVAWEPTISEDRAFLVESFWFHQLELGPYHLNVIHPARPTASHRVCPYCHNQDGEAKALERALGRPVLRSDNDSVTVHYGGDRGSEGDMK